MKIDYKIDEEGNWIVTRLALCDFGLLFTTKFEGKSSL
jgi:hypothetical protein